jgi:hypothetical protein
MMKRAHPWVTVIIQTDGSLEKKQTRMPMWLARGLLIAGIVIAALVVLGAAFYLPLARTAARVPGLERRITRLEGENARIGDLARALDSAEARYARLRQMIGADIVPDRPAALRPDDRHAAPRRRGRGPEALAARRRGIRHPGAGGG